MTTRILVFGAGSAAEKLINCFSSEAEIVAFIDNDDKKWGDYFHTYPILSPQEGINRDYEYIIVAIFTGYEHVARQLYQMGIEKKQIIAPFSFMHEHYSQWRRFMNIEELIYLEMEQKIERLNAHIENLEYELVSKLKKNVIQYPKILSCEEAIKEIVQKKKSMSRFGDGEFDLMLGRRNSFQKVDEELTRRLKEIIVSHLENHIVAIPDAYGDFENRTEEFKDCFRKHFQFGGRVQEYAMLDMEKEYYDAFITRPYKDFIDKTKVKEKFVMIKMLWEGRDITIVEGKKTRMGVGNDLFANVKSCMRILGPEINAFEKYDQILKAVLATDKDRLILIALGATATVLAYDLAILGYQALDIGHIDVEYEWFLHSAKEKVPIRGKYVNEAPGGRNVQEYIEDDNYNREIVKIIC